MIRYEDITAEKFRERAKNAKLYEALEIMYRSNDNAILFPDEVNKSVLKEIENRGFKIKFFKNTKKMEAHYKVSW